MLLADQTAGIVAISMVVIVLGYGLVAVLFYGMVYRPSRRAKEEEREKAQRDAGEHDQ